MTVENNIILNHQEILHKIRRMAYQIYENNVNETEVVLAGIDVNGYILAKKIKTALSQISDLQIVLCKVTIDKKNPLAPVTTSIPSKSYANKSVILVDDVLNSGSTLIYSVKHFLDVPLKRFKTAVLVNRNHKKYPVKADYKGISLSTTLQEHVNVIMEKDNFKAVLE